MNGLRGIGRLALMIGLTAGLWVLTPVGHASAAEEMPSGWVGDFQVGVIGNTVNGTGFAFNMGFDRYLASNLSVGPFVQIVNAGDLVQTGLSGMVKLWIDAKKGEHPLRINLQGGAGFVHASFGRNDTSWMLPIGAEVDYEFQRGWHLASTFLLTVTDLDTGRGDDTIIMPTWTIGLRF
jgi:hypothetical protein